MMNATTPMPMVRTRRAIARAIKGTAALFTLSAALVAITMAELSTESPVEGGTDKPSDHDPEGGIHGEGGNILGKLRPVHSGSGVH